MLTGMLARRSRTSTFTRRPSRKVRSAPATVASTMSLSVPPRPFFTAFTSARSNVAQS